MFNSTSLFAHLHLERPPVDSNGAVRVDAAGDQEPFVDQRGSVPERLAFAAISWRNDDAPVGDRCWRVAWSLAIGTASRLEIARSGAGVVKQVSLVRRHPEIDRATFAERYRAHVPIVRAHHGVAGYAQSVVLEPVYGVDGDEDRIDGISELWFASRADWRDRYFLASDSRDVVIADAGGFLDFATTRSILAEEHVDGHRLKQA